MGCRVIHSIRQISTTAGHVEGKVSCESLRVRQGPREEFHVLMRLHRGTAVVHQAYVLRVV